MLKKIVGGNYDFSDPVWGAVSDDAKDLVRCLLVVKPKHRLTAEQALQHK